MDMDVLGGAADERRGFDRRAFIRRTAVVSATAVWATPTVQSMVAPAFATGTASGDCGACLTGGGQIVSTTTSPVLYNGTSVTSLSFGLTGGGSICCAPTGPTQIEVNAHGWAARSKDDPSWHFTQITSLVCTKTGSPAPPPQTADCPNRFTGTATDGTNTLEFVFEDNGEPGQMVDFVSISIYGPQGTLTGTGLLDRGNLQVHESLGPIHRDCTGC